MAPLVFTYKCVGLYEFWLCNNKDRITGSFLLFPLFLPLLIPEFFFVFWLFAPSRAQLELYNAARFQSGAAAGQAGARKHGHGKNRLLGWEVCVCVCVCVCLINACNRLDEGWLEAARASPVNSFSRIY